MRRHAGIAVACCVALACSKSEEKKVSSEQPPAHAVSACDTPPLADLIQQHPIHVLLGAADVLEDASAIGDSTFADWTTFDPENLHDRTTPARVEAGIRRLCATIDALPPSKQSSAVVTVTAPSNANRPMRRSAHRNCGSSRVRR